MYLNVKKLLPYQRNFIFVNGERSIGKTYSTLKFIISSCIKNSTEFVYIVRTQSEKKEGIFKQALQKVLTNEFKTLKTDINNDDFYIENNEIKIQLGYCLALSEAPKIKLRSFPKVKYIIFDEYTLEEKQQRSYINGFKEPDLLLSIYHTIDREEDRVICFMLGNNTSFYNPYHLHPAFNIPPTKRNRIWCSKNVLFYWATSDNELKEKKSNCKFLEMINNTDYGKYAKDGEYIEDNYNFIDKNISGNYYCTILYNNESFGIVANNKKGLCYVTNKIDPYKKIVFALTKDDHTENTMLTKGKKNTLLKWIIEQYKLGNIRFVNMEIKTKFESAIKLLL